MSRIRDLFFDEFYDELERVAVGLEKDEAPEGPTLLAEEVNRRWREFSPDPEGREGALVSVDGGVQFSSFAYGDFVSVGRACALTHWPGREQPVSKDVKIYVGEVFDDRDRGFIPGYVRMITEYRVAHQAASRVLEQGGLPVVLMDGSLYFGRFPYAVREYLHHGELLTELFDAITGLRCLARDHGFPLGGVIKDSTVFYMYMALMRKAVLDAGLGWMGKDVEEASSPLSLRLKAEQWHPDKRAQAEAFLERRPLCDTALVNEVAKGEGYTQPLLLAPSIYYGRDTGTPDLYKRIRNNVGDLKADPMIRALEGFFKCPGVAVTYWKPSDKARPFRVDVSASWLGHSDPWDRLKSNMFVDPGTDLKPLEMVLNHLGYWYVNPIEYNVPLRQADMLARFDRELYRQKYEPFIVKRLERAGLLVTDSRRDIREIDG